MPDFGFYAKRPRPEHRTWLTTRLRSNPNVLSVAFHDEHRFSIERSRKSTIEGYLTNQYIISEADVLEILEQNADLNTIVSTMGYSHYSAEAKAAARERGVGLFKGPELLGAVWYDGQSFLDYVPPDRG